MKLVNIHTIEAKLVCETGLHIGASVAQMHIGGIDSEVVKHPFTNEPYLPGSSLKGKMRCLLEWTAGIVDRSIQNQGEEAIAIAKLFGSSCDSNYEVDLGPTRISVWDAPLTREWVAAQKENYLPLTEEKAENRIDIKFDPREKVNKLEATPRFIERVPAGAEFKFKVVVKVFEGDDDKLMDLLFKGLKLLEMDGIGGSGSRGYGKIVFSLLTINGEDAMQRLKDVRLFDKA